MQELPLNMWVVLGAGLARFFIGWFWFMPGIFMKPWLESIGMSENEAKKNMKKGMVVGMLTHLAGSLLMACVLAHAIKYAQMAHGLPDGLAGGLAGGFINWLGLVAVAQIDGVTAEKRPFAWFLVSSGYQLAGLLVMGAILALWA